jgi:hypothetical protein
MDEDKIARFIKEGRGQGEGADYKPFLTIHDVPSNGLSSRVPGRKTGRLHHTLSKIERALILIYVLAPVQSRSAGGADKNLD